jgi:hypothetical protein
MTRADHLITLPRTRFLYVALISLVVLPAVVLIVLWPGLSYLWCREVDMPQYE